MILVDLGIDYGLNAHLSNTTKVTQATGMPGYVPLRSTLR